MDGCGQMVFCTHLSYIADREGGEEKGERERKREKPTKKEVFIDCRQCAAAQNRLPLFKSSFTCSASSSLCACVFPVSAFLMVLPLLHSAKPDTYWRVQTQHPADHQTWHPLRPICLTFTKIPSMLFLKGGL